MSTSSPATTPLFVVPCLNEIRHIGPLLLQLRRAQSRLGGTIVVADGGSSDGTRETVLREVARAPGLHLIDNEKRLQSAGVNAAVQAFGEGASHLIRIDAHCAYPEDFCDVLLADAAETGAASVVVSMEAVGEGPFQRAIAAAQNATVGNGGSKHRLASSGQFVDHGHHALIAADAFRKAGGYDPRFSHNEDAEFDHRLTRLGYRIWLTGRVRIKYFPREGYRPLARQYFNYGSGRARNLLKHRERPKIRQAKVIAVLPFVSLAGLTPVHPAFLGPAILWMAACLALAVPLAVRDRAADLLIAAPMAMVMHLSWSAGFWAEVFSRIRLLTPRTE